MNERKVKRLASESRRSASDDSNDVLVEQFTRDFHAVIQQIKDKQQSSRTSNTENSFLDENERLEVAFYGPIAQKLVMLVHKLVHFTDELSLAKKEAVLLKFGSLLYDLKEFRASEMFFYQPVLDGYIGQSEKKRGQVFVTAIYGSAMCRFQRYKRADLYIRYLGTLKQMIEALTMLQNGIEIAVQLEQEKSNAHTLVWLILNGSILIFTIAKPLQRLGFEREVVPYLKWCLLAMESVITLCTTKYILWRMQICVSVCECYEAIARKQSARRASLALKSAAACAEYAEQVVHRLRKEEELDLPLPKEVARILSLAETSAKMLSWRTKAAINHDLIGRQQIITVFIDVGDQIRVALDRMEQLTSADTNCIGFLTPPSSVMEQELTGLLTFILEIVSPLLTQLSEGNDQSPASLDAILPLSFHLMLLRHCYRLKRHSDLDFLLKMARLRISPKQEASNVETGTIDAELGLYKALCAVKVTSTAPDDFNSSPPPSLLVLAKSGTALPPTKLLIKLANALKKCVSQVHGTMAHTNRDLLVAVATLLWRDFGSFVINELDASEQSQLPKQLLSIAIDILLSIHLAFTAVELDDLLLHGHICLRLCSALGQQQKYRLSSQIGRRMLERISTRREELAQMSAHFCSVTTDGTMLSSPTFSFGATLNRDGDSSNNCFAKDHVRDKIGVKGTGSQFGSMYQDLCCLQTDLYMLLYHSELNEAVFVDTLREREPESGRPTLLQDNVPSLLSIVEEKLQSECRKNGYLKALLGIRRIQLPTKDSKEQIAIVDDCMKTIRRMEVQEQELQSRLNKHSQSVLGKQQHSVESSSLVPQPPVVVARSSGTITVEIVPYQPATPALRKRQIAYYMVFAKSSGAGTAVSLTNNQLSGTAEPIYPPTQQQKQTRQTLVATISGLISNESYVFAVAAFDVQNQIIQGIGETSNPVVALDPLPVTLCYGYLAQVCYELKLMDHARSTATALYDTLVSQDQAKRPLWRANQFYRHALKRNIVAQLPIPILNVGIQAILILSHHELGDSDHDGLLLSDSDQKSLIPQQVDVIEASRRIAMGMDLACAAGNLEAIRVLCFKGYRILLPFLHCDYGEMVYPALMIFFQALQVIPHAKWDVDTRSICSRIEFELFRVAMNNRHLTQVTLSSLLSINEEKAPSDLYPTESLTSNEFRAVSDVLALHSLTADTSSTPASNTLAKIPPAASVAPVVSKGPTPNTPQSTPRNVTEVVKTVIPPLNEIINLGGHSLAESFKVIEPFANTDPHNYIMYACKLCTAGLQYGQDAQVEKWLDSIKVMGKTSDQLRLTLTSVGGENLLNESQRERDNLTPGESPLSTARSTKTPRQGQTKEGAPTSSTLEIDVPAPSTSILNENAVDEDNDMLYLWCGEIFFIQSLIRFRKMVMLRTTSWNVDPANGPNRNYAYDLFRPKQDDNSQPSTGIAQAERVKATNLEQEQQHVDATDNDSALPRPSDEMAELFDQFLQKIYAASRLYRVGKAWHALQAATQYLQNAIWTAWISPGYMSASAVREAQFSSCVDDVLGMIETAQFAIRHEKSDQIAGADVNAMQNTTSSFNQSLIMKSFASTTVVSSAMSSLGTDQQWISSLVSYAVMMFTACSNWVKIVEVGTRYHFLMGTSSGNSSVDGTRFSEHNLPIILYAQRQILETNNARVEHAKTELNEYIRVFMENEGKKKKKKSRLVVEETLSAEEQEFRDKKLEMEHHLQSLTDARNREQLRLQQLEGIYESLMRSMNKCLQSLDSCHQLLEQYRSESQNLTSSSLHREIVNAYMQCIALSRQKRQKRIVCQALSEVGDFHLACGDTRMAVKSWHEALDNALNTLNVVRNWRDVVNYGSSDQSLNGTSNIDKIIGDELWVGLQSCNTLAKLILHSSGFNCYQAVEYALMAATIFARFYACSLAHPSKSFLYGTYRIGAEFWPGRPLVGDLERVSSFQFDIMLVLTPEVLLQYENYAVPAMPVIAGYEYISTWCLEDVNHIGNARRLRVEALIQCGRFHEALDIVADLLHGVELHNPVKKRGPNPYFSILKFHDSLPPQDTANQTAITWLTTLDVPKLHADLLLHYDTELAHHILVTILRLAVSLSRHDGHLGSVSTLHLSVVKIGTAIFQELENVNIGEEHPQTDASYPLPSEISQHLRAVRTEVLLQQSYLAYHEGKWNISREFSEKAVGMHQSVQPSTPLSTPPVLLDLDRQMKYSFFHRRSTLIAKCRIQSIMCHLAQGNYHIARSLADVAVTEARESGEQHLTVVMEILKAQATVFLGERERADTDLFVLRDACIAHSLNDSVQYVQLLLIISSLLRSKAILTDQYSIIDSALDRLIEAESVLNNILERDGWSGVDSVKSERDKRMNLYHPALPTFIKLKMNLARMLLECPFGRARESMIRHGDNILRLIQTGILALAHTTAQLGPTKAFLLLLRGSVLRKLLVIHRDTKEKSSHQPLSMSNMHTTISLTDSSMSHEEHLFTDCVEALTESVRVSINEGGHDRRLMRMALVELVDLFGQKILTGKEELHIQAAFHYLTIAVEIYNQEQLLFDTLDLQNGSLDSLDKLPSFVLDVINEQIATQTGNTKVDPSINAKKNGAVAAEGSRSAGSDAAQVVNYFIRLLRERQTLPVCTEIQQESSLVLHTFLDDPEIRAGLICSHWGRDLTPALRTPSVEAVSHDSSQLTLYFTLGTTRIPVVEDNSENAILSATRMQKFASTPLLSKRAHLSDKWIQSLKVRISELRTRMDDAETSFVIDRNAFEYDLHSILEEIQRIFRNPQECHSLHGTEVFKDDNNEHDAAISVKIQENNAVNDIFNNPIHLPCTMELVRNLENFFTVEKGVNVSDNLLCYFLRDLLDEKAT